VRGAPRAVGRGDDSRGSRNRRPGKTRRKRAHGEAARLTTWPLPGDTPRGQRTIGHGIGPRDNSRDASNRRKRPHRQIPFPLLARPPPGDTSPGGTRRRDGTVQRDLQPLLPGRVCRIRRERGARAAHRGHGCHPARRDAADVAQETLAPGDPGRPAARGRVPRAARSLPA
ncbi:hypothetical protein AB4Z54_61770, partial [Streptomyces sp. MCAF7]